MEDNKNCPYCLTRLTSGKYGNTWTCLLCNKKLCGKCVDSGICAVHHHELSKEQIKEVKRLYRNFNITIMTSTFGLIGGFILLLLGVGYFIDSSIPILLIVVIGGGVLMIFGIGWMIIKSHKQYNIKMNAIKSYITY